MTFVLGQRVWFNHAKDLRTYGTVEVVDDGIGVRVDGDRDLTYNIEGLHALDDGVYPPSFGYTPDPNRLSPNAAKKLIQPGGPAKFDWERRHKKPSTPAFDFGKVAHHLVLGEGDQFSVLSPEIHGLKKDGGIADNPRATATWKQAEAAARAEGFTPIHSDDYAKAVAMANAVHAHPLAAAYVAQGDAEHWLYATEPETGQGLRMRADWMTQQDRLYVVEYKTAADANPNVFARKAYDFGYHIACAFAVTCARLLELDESPAYLTIVQEKEPPYLVSVCEFDMDAYLLGRKQMQQAIQTYQRCMETGEWPGYDQTIHSISLPPWAFADDQPTVNDLLEGATQ